MAAVANGADAVYFGVDAFNIRQRAENFRIEELGEVMTWLHERQVRGFLTFNVLVFSDELERAAALLLAAQAAGVDALIVQDVGLCCLARTLVPDLALHGSTQMSITSAAGVAQAAALGCERVVLARELALTDLERLQGQLQARHLAMPLEVFVHGALCVAYSGQCLTSESLGQRSANRGECAQACRLPYELIVDGVPRPLGDQRYLLSPQDLSAWPVLPELQRIGIASLKIEGRLKDPTYVAAVTDAYRRGLDRGLNPAEQDDPQRQLELAFSRGLSTGWLQGVNHRRLVHGRWSKKRGPLVGQLLQVDRSGWLQIRSRESLRPGQGLVLERRSTSPLQPPEEVGGRVMVVERLGRERLRLKLGPGRLNLRDLTAGASVWLTSDPSWDSHWQRAAQRPTASQSIGLQLRVRGRLDQPLVLETIDGATRISSRMLLQAAQQRSHDLHRLEEQLGRLGGSDWVLERAGARPCRGSVPACGGAESDAPGAAGAASAATTHAPSQVPLQSSEMYVPSVLRQLLPVTSLQPSTDLAGLVVLVRSLAQLEALIPLTNLPISSVVADLEQPRDLREAVAIGRGHWPDGIWLAGARITRPNESWSLEPSIRARPDGYLVRNADQLERLTPLAPCVGDFSLNTANPLSARWDLEHWGLERVTASYDLNLQQLLDLAAGVDPSRIEVTLHQHMPMFHMDHCVFCAFLSHGHDHTDCGRPCEQHTVTLRDRSGVEHPLRADLGCRNTLFNGTAQTGVEGLPALLEIGIRQVRLELLDEDAASTQRRVRLYADALLGRRASRDVWSQEQIHHQLGVTRGSLRVKGPERTSQISR